MASLPFVVQPRRKPIKEVIGSEESGQIEIERRGYLTSGEKSFVQQVQQSDNGSDEIITLSRQVARRYSLGMDKAYRTVLSIIAGTEVSEADRELVSNVEDEFAEALTAVVKGMVASQTREELVYATCLLKYRVDPDFEIPQINFLHPDIVSGLAKLYREEEARSIEAFQSDEKLDAKEPSIEEVEKKPSETTGSRSKSTTGG